MYEQQEPVASQCPPEACGSWLEQVQRRFSREAVTAPSLLQVMDAFGRSQMCGSIPRESWGEPGVMSLVGQLQFGTELIMGCAWV